MVSREAVEWGYHMILGRPPESEDVVAYHCRCRDIDHLRETMIRSEEGCRKLRYDMQHAVRQLPLDYFRPAFAFIHIEKTGGTSFYNAAIPAFEIGRVSLPHVADVSSYSISELSQYDFISAHMTYAEAMAFPRSKTFVMAMFRDPLARLISFYRFHRSHPASRRDHSAVSLAQDLSAEEFFSDAEIRADPRLDNRYLRILADVRDNEVAGSRANHLTNAIERLRRLDAIGLTERFDQSVALFSARSNLMCITELQKANVTDELHLTEEGFRAVEPFEITPGLREIVEPLIRHDRVIYDEALICFDQMVAQSLKPDRQARWIDHLKAGLATIGFL